jgi:hypothetical protein
MDTCSTGTEVDSRSGRLIPERDVGLSVEAPKKVIKPTNDEDQRRMLPMIQQTTAVHVLVFNIGYPCLKWP